LKKTVVIALGGNAIKKLDEKGTFEEQMININETCKHLVEIVKKGYRIVITHGNGPQVGNLLIQQEEAKDLVPPQPLDVVGSMTQGQIGYMLQQALRNNLVKAKIDIPVVTVLTQVIVNPNDPNFENPSKPVGPFYTKEEAEVLCGKRGYIIKMVNPNVRKGYRRVVPSPDPLFIVERDVIKYLINAGVIVIACGGGGIPVISTDANYLQGVEAVIDKDLASEKLAESIRAEIFLILTDIEKVKLNYGKPNQIDIDRMSISEAKRYLMEGHFLEGSMKPKVIACIKFIESGGEKAIISSLDKAVDALEGKAGTLIVRD
jgi:carbamate kinase